MDIQVVAQEKIAGIIANGTVEKMIEDQITKVLSKIVQDVFAEYGDFGKQVKEAIGTKMQLNLNNMKIDGYTMVVNQTIEKALNGAIAEEYAGKIQKLVQYTLGLLEKKEWKLSELAKWYYDKEIADSYNDEYKLWLEVGDSEYSSTWVRIGKISKTSSYSWSKDTPDKEVKILIDTKTKKIKGTWYQGKLTNPLLGKVWDHNIESLLMKLWVEECTLDIDVEDANDVECDDYND